MSAPVDDGGPAFPQGHPEMTIVGQSAKETQGMSLRDHFAGLALQGGLSSTETLQQAALVALQVGGKITLEQLLAIRSYAFADAMLAARKEKA